MSRSSSGNVSNMDGMVYFPFLCFTNKHTAGYRREDEMIFFSFNENKKPLFLLA